MLFYDHIDLQHAKDKLARYLERHKAEVGLEYKQKVRELRKLIKFIENGKGISESKTIK